LLRPRTAHPTSLTTDASRDYTVKTDVIGPQADITHYYRFRRHRVHMVDQK